eukprot:753299-Hanusia_phi.AAC.6
MTLYNLRRRRLGRDKMTRSPGPHEPSTRQMTRSPGPHVSLLLVPFTSGVSQKDRTICAAFL